MDRWLGSSGVEERVGRQVLLALLNNVGHRTAETIRQLLNWRSGPFSATSVQLSTQTGQADPCWVLMERGA